MQQHEQPRQVSELLSFLAQFSRSSLLRLVVEEEGEEVVWEIWH